MRFSILGFPQGHPKCFYQGTVDGYPSWTVALSTCSGIRLGTSIFRFHVIYGHLALFISRGSFGDMATKTSLFHIEPLGDNKNRTVSELMSVVVHARALQCYEPHLPAVGSAACLVYGSWIREQNKNLWYECYECWCFDRCYGVYVYACRNFTRPQCKARGNKKGITSFGGKGTLTTIGASYVQERRLFY